ncbi:MAG: Gfo/Idh/MocA family oxidoreductase [Bryobacterales bacterium]|nr:Gfo/Idh/MocA family oxidoreductase [Bryobacterales bacterium]
MVKKDRHCDTRFQELHVLLAGCGSIGKRHARILKELGVGRLTVCDPVPAQIEALMLQTPSVEACASFQLGLDAKPDAVFILTPPKQHVPMAVDAVRAGCHVFVEKPVSDSLDGVEPLAELVRRSASKVMIGLCFRYHRGLRKAKALIESGTIGRLISIRALMGEHLPQVRPDFQSLFSAQYSGAFDLMHDLDLAIWFANQRVEAVQALYGTCSDIGISAPDLVEILIGFEDRCTASVHLDFFQRPRRRQIELIGSDGTIIVEFARWDQYTLSTYRPDRNDWESLSETVSRDDMFRDEDRAFLSATVGNGEIDCTIDEACKSLRVIAAAQGMNSLWKGRANPPKVSEAAREREAAGV